MAIVWAANEIENVLIAKGVEGARATNIALMVKALVGSTGLYTGVSRDASLILALHNIIRPTVDVARACWGVVGVAGTTAALDAAIQAWIAVNRPDLIAVAPAIALMIHGYFGDTTPSLVASKEVDDDVNSSTYGSSIVRSPDKYARAVASFMTAVTKALRVFAGGTVVYPAGSYDVGLANIGPLLDDALRAT